MVPVRQAWLLAQQALLQVHGKVSAQTQQALVRAQAAWVESSLVRDSQLALIRARSAQSEIAWAERPPT